MKILATTLFNLPEQLASICFRRLVIETPVAGAQYGHFLSSCSPCTTRAICRTRIVPRRTACPTSSSIGIWKYFLTLQCPHDNETAMLFGHGPVLRHMSDNLRDAVADVISDANAKNCSLYPIVIYGIMQKESRETSITIYNARRP